jgi:hypothetical protein
MTSVVNAVFRKAWLPMVVTPLPREIDVSLVHSRNAWAPMEVTESGIVTLVRPVQL